MYAPQSEMAFGGSGLGYGVEGLGFGVCGIGFRVQGIRLRGELCSCITLYHAPPETCFMNLGLEIRSLFSGLYFRV